MCLVFIVGKITVSDLKHIRVIPVAYACILIKTDCGFVYCYD